VAVHVEFHVSKLGGESGIPEKTKAAFFGGLFLLVKPVPCRTRHFPSGKTLRLDLIEGNREKITQRAKKKPPFAGRRVDREASKVDGTTLRPVPKVGPIC
jgi:hypothetical protein